MANPARRIGLRVKVYKKDPISFLGESGGNIDGGCCFPNTAFLITECEYFWMFHVKRAIEIIPFMELYTATKMVNFILAV